NAFKIAIVDRMIFRQRREALFGWVQARTFRDRPRAEHSFHLQAKIVVKTGGMMLLNDEAVARLLLHFTGWLRCFIELTFLFVLFEAHADVFCTPFLPIIPAWAVCGLKRRKPFYPSAKHWHTA